MFKLLITDLDDTLYPWLSFFVPAFYAMAEKVSEISGVDIEILLDEYRDVHREKGTVEYPFTTLLLPSIREIYAGKKDEDIKDELKPAFATFNRVRTERLHLFSGVEETLRELSNKGVRIVGFTDSGELNGFYRLQLLDIADYFSKVYVSNYEYHLPDHVVRDHRIREAKNGKPDSELLLQIIEAEGMKIPEAVYMGDSLTKDIFMANEVGVTSIHCQYPKSELQSEYEKKLIRISSWTEDTFLKENKIRKQCELKQIKPDYVITDYREIQDILFG